MRLDTFVNEGGNTSSATNMESIIVDIWNGTDKSIKRFPHLVDDGQAAVDFLKSNGVYGKAKHLGGSNKGPPVSSEWKKYGGSNNTPKTDFLIGDFRISLKKAGGSQLMSGGQAESTATIMAALSKSSVLPAEAVDDMEEYLKKMVMTSSPDTITKTRQGDSDIAKTVIDADVVHKEFKKYLDNVFKNNFGFKKAMVHEAMTGQTKFGDKSISRAEWVLVFGGNLSWDNTDRDPFLSNKTKNTKLAIGWKSMKNKKSGTYNVWSALRLMEDIRAEQRCFDSVDEGAITDKIKTWFKTVWSKIKVWLSQSWDNIFKFLGLQPVAVMSETKF